MNDVGDVLLNGFLDISMRFFYGYFVHSTIVSIESFVGADGKKPTGIGHD